MIVSQVHKNRCSKRVKEFLSVLPHLLPDLVEMMYNRGLPDTNSGTGSNSKSNSTSWAKTYVTFPLRSLFLKFFSVQKSEDVNNFCA